MKPGFEGGQLPIIKRLPSQRGFTNIFKTDYDVVNVGQLSVFEAGTEVDIVKFALYFPPPAEISRINRDALGIVEKTKPAEEPAPAGAELPLPESRKTVP